MLAEGETFVELLKDPAHWGFEAVTMIFFEGVLFLLVWAKLIKPHFHRDIEHATHAHELHEEHVEDRQVELEKAIEVALWHLDEGDGETAYKVLLRTKEEGQ